MTKYRVGFTTVVEQFITVEVEDADFESEFDLEEAVLDEAYNELQGVPFLGWNWYEGGNWEFDDDYGIQKVDDDDD